MLENEYGAFGSDKAYLRALADILKKNFDGFLYTNDQPSQVSLSGGSLPGVLAEVDGKNSTEAFDSLRKYITDNSMRGPLLNGEMYITWFDAWGSGQSHQTKSGDAKAIDTAVADLEWVLKNNHSFSIYMFHGGTNFGFENGSKFVNGLKPVTSSYDYGAPLDESGRPTDVYYKLRNMISKYVAKDSIPEVPTTSNLTVVDEFTLYPAVSLYDTLPTEPSKRSAQPVTMESLGQSYGFVLFEHIVTEDVSGALAPGDEPRDRIIVHVNGKKVGVTDRTYATPTAVQLSLKKGDVLRLLVENLGRVDYDRILQDQAKGIVGAVKIGAKTLNNWSTYSIPLTSLPEKALNGTSSNSANIQDGPVFYSGIFRLKDGASNDLTGDMFLSLPSGVKGQVWVNGINLGRYWDVGPQQSLYVPGVYLQANGTANQVVVLELEPQADVTMIGRGIATREWGNNQIKAYATIQAENYTTKNGTKVQSTLDVGGGDNVGWIHAGNWLAYRHVNFGSAGAKQFTARIASGTTVSGEIQVVLDSRTATPICSVSISSTGGWQNWTNKTASVSAVTGVHSVYLVFKSHQPDDFVNVNWFSFSE
ncbi:beta-calactosidase [Purpureocillium lavendulum]|uniref:Beta-calactosidase n=1 Tax=Purpureocillium lavendulum TaxID=1247861 RepID=A0AB34FCE2_9HYPO|nr:beta-calactosidase [Purpureocillium lavendulum]